MGSDRLFRWMFGYIGPLVFVAALLVCLSDRSTLEAAVQGGGHAGTMVLRKRHCNGSHCYWMGPFHSDDGQVDLETAFFSRAAADARVGQEVRVRAAGYGSVVFDMEGKAARDAEYLNNAMIVLSMVYLVLWLAWVTRLWRALFVWWARRPPSRRGPDLIADTRSYLDKS